MPDESIQDKLARRSQPSWITTKDGREYRVVSSKSKGGRIVVLGVDPGNGGSIEWIDADRVQEGR